METGHAERLKVHEAYPPHFVSPFCQLTIRFLLS